MANMWGSRSESSIVGSESRVEIRPLMRMVYLWMTTGLLITTAVAVTVSSIPSLRNLVTNPAIMIGAIIGELVLVMAISFGMRRMSPTTASVLFLLYSAVNGFTLSLIFLVYTKSAITGAFLSTTALFGVMTVVGFTTQVDLTKYRSYFMIGLIGLVIAMVINMFLNSSAIQYVISLFGVVLFTALTAYDTQRIKRMAADPQIEADGNLSAKLSILGALALYLDFINLFLFLLRLFGGNRR